MKYFFSLLLLPLLLISQKQDTYLCKNSQYILQQSITFHDPAGEWPEAQLQLEIREPRIQGADRFSNLNLDIKTGVFSLERNRGEHVSLHQINAEGEAASLLDNQVVTEPEKIKQLFLEPERNANYRGYYQFFYGLPMNLTADYATLKKVGEQKFQGQRVISMDYELKMPMIAKTWRIFFSPEDYRVLGVQTMDEEAGEYLVFNGEAQLGQMTVPRFRHWYDAEDDTYLGSDILVKGSLGNQ